MNLLINLPPSFFTQPELAPHFARLASLTKNIRHTSHNGLAEFLPDLQWADAVMMWSWPAFTETELAVCPKLKFVGQINTAHKTASALLNRAIPHSEARHAWSPAVAEMALTLILGGLRRTSDYHAQMRSGTESWVQDFPGDIDTRERSLTGASVGIVGFGRIGQRLAELLRPFGCLICVYDPFVPESVLSAFGVVRTEILALARQSDIVVLCAANTDGARHIFDAEAIDALPKGALLVNVGRSLLIDMSALIERLKRNDLVALLDVFDKEPLETDSELRKFSNVYLTPHRAGGILASVTKSLDWLIDDFEAVLKQQPLAHPVTEAMLSSLSNNG
jgi:phosphoglycerate dehydrogenase-like enzyme